MTYFDVANLANDQEFISRSAAAYSIETLADAGRVNPVDWANQNSWGMAAQPGFGDAYSYALLSGNPHPGSDPAVITDAMILSAVQSLIGTPPTGEV